MDEFLPVSPLARSAAFEQLLHSPVGSPMPAEFTERSGSYLSSIMNDELSPSMVHEEAYNLNSESMVSPVSFVNQDQSASMMFPLTSLDSMPYGNDTTSCEQCGALVSNNQDAIMSHLQQCCSDDQLSMSNTKKIEKSFVDIKPATPAMAAQLAVTYNGDDQQLAQVKWEKYMRTLQVKMAPDYNFSTKSYTFEVPGLDPGMKLEAIDKNNPQSFCVATVVEVIGHRVRIRYDGYGRDSSNDFWCNFQAEELYPIGWCAQNAFPLQPPTGINCTLEEWRKFLTQTLTGALAAPKHLFPSEHYQPKVHAFEIGMKLEVIHPTKPYVFCAATVVKSLGPYYFLVATDKVDSIPNVTMCCHSDSSNIFPAGWSYKNGIEFTVPSGYTRNTFSWEEYIASCRAVRAPQHLFKKSKSHKFRAGHKLEAVDLEHPHAILVTTITNVMGRVLQLFFDGQTRFQFVECDSPDIHGFGWCKRTGHPLLTPYGKMPFKTVTKYEGSESFSKQLKLISFADVIGRKPTPPNVANPTNLETSNAATAATAANPAISHNSATPSLAANYNHPAPRNPTATPNLATPNLASPTNHLGSPNPTTPNNPPPYNLTTPHNLTTASNATHSLPPTAPSMLAVSSSIVTQPYPTTSGPDHPAQDKSVISLVVEPDENSEDKEKCPTLSPSDDDEDLSDEDGTGTGSERFYHNKNQIYFNKTCCCGPLLNPEEVKLLPDASEPGKVSTVIRIGLEMVAKCAKDPERVLEMMQEGSGVRLMIKHNGKTFKKAISRVDSRPKLERYLKRFCRRLVCCEYFLSLTPVAGPCPDDCKADQYGNLQGPKGMKAKRAREYFETKHLGYEKKKRGRKSKAVANEAAAQREAAGIVTSVFHKGNHVPLPNLSLPVTAIADHLRNTATKILHQVQASQGMLQSKAATSSSTVMTQTTVAPSPTHALTSHPSTSHPPTPHPSTSHSSIPNTPTNSTHHPTPPATTTHPTPPVSSVQVPTYGKPRLLPSPYGPPPLPITTSTETSGATTGNGRGSSYRGGRNPNPPPKKVIPIIPAGPIPERNIPLVEIPIHIPPANKLPLPARSTAIPVTTITVTSDNATPSVQSAKPVFRPAPPKFIAHSQLANSKTASTFPGRLVALPQSLATSGNYAPLANHSSQTTSVTTNQHPIPASISLSRAGPPPLIPARAIPGTPNPKGVQILRPRLSEGKVVAAAPNVCVTERGTFIATQLNKTSVPSSGACVMNHVVGQSPDANAMMNKMFSVVSGSENGIPATIAAATVVANVRRTQTPQIAHVHPSIQNENSHQNTNNSHQNTNNSHQNTNNPYQNTNNSHQNTNNSNQNTIKPNQNINQNTNITNQNTRKPNQNTNNSYQNTNVPNQNYQSANRTNNSMVKYDKNANIGSQSTVQKFSLNVGGGMGAVTTAVRSGMLAREKYQPPDASRNTKHVITHGGGYSVKINENNLETKPRIRSTITNIPDRRANQSDISPNASDRTRNQSVITPNLAEVNPTVSEVSPTLSEEIPMMADIATNENEVENNETKDDLDNVPISKRGSTWMYRRRKKKKVRFTYVKGKKNKKKEGNEIQENFEENRGVFEQAFDDGGQVAEHLKRRGRGMKRDHDDVDDKNDPPYAPPHTSEISPKRARRSSELISGQVGTTPAEITSSYVTSSYVTSSYVTSSYVTSPKAELMKGVLHAVQSSQHPSVKLRSPNEKQLHSLNGFSSPPKRSRVHSTDSVTSRKGRVSFSPKTGTKTNTSRERVSVNAGTNTSLPGCPSDKCLYHPENPRLWTVDLVGEYIAATDCKNYATYFMDQEIDGESLLMLTRSTLMQFTNMKLGPTLKLSNYIAQLRARVGMSKHT